MTFTFKTPPIPRYIRELICEGYKSIFEFNVRNENLFGTETLCGDWDGDLLIVAEHFAPTSVIESRLREGESHPYRHDPAFPTNKNLVLLLQENGREIQIDGTGNTSCGVLYMSACFFLRIDGETSGALPNQTECARDSCAVFEFTIGKMPNLEKIACLGKFAFDFVRDYFNYAPTRWRDCLDHRTPIYAGRYSVYAHAHLGYFGATINRSMEEIREDWRSMFSGGEATPL